MISGNIATDCNIPIRAGVCEFYLDGTTSAWMESQMLCKLMGTYGNLWELMGTYGSVWELVGTYGNWDLWELMGT